MKQKYEGTALRGLVDLGQVQGYLTFEQVNEYLLQEAPHRPDLRPALDSLGALDIKVQDQVPAEGADTDPAFMRASVS